MDNDQERGVVFPAAASGRRSTAAVGRAVVADALGQVDPVGARAAEHETNWRSGYIVHFRRLVEAGLASPEAALSIADDGRSALNQRMRVIGEDGEERPLDDWVASEATRPLVTAEVRGTGEPETELSLPYHGSRLRGDALRAQLDTWVTAGVMEPSAAEAVRTVAANPDWLRLEGHTVAVLGAGAEMGPLRALLRWGARVAAVDLPRAKIWDGLMETAHQGAGTLVLPAPREPETSLDTVAAQPARPPSLDTVAAQPARPPSPGADLIVEAPAVAQWLAQLTGTVVLGNYVYADGATNVRASVAVDALTTWLLDQRADTALAFLATPTDVFAVPRDAVEQSTGSYEGRSVAAKLVGRPLRAVSGGRLLRRAYPPGADPGISDSLVAQQGPNYVLAKRLQRWRATVARHSGTTVSMNVAPPTRTKSVLKNRALAAAYAGAHRFGVEVFDPATSNVLMTALLVHDLHTGGGPVHQHPWQDETHAAVHGGLWRAPYAPRSALGLAALLGYGAAGN